MIGTQRQFIKSEIEVNFDRTLNRNAIVVYQALVRYMSQETRIAMVRIKILAALIGRSVGTVQRGLRDLIARGVIIRQARYSASDGHQLCSAFYIVGADAECYQTPVSETPMSKMEPPHVKNGIPIYIDLTKSDFYLTASGGAKTPQSYKKNDTTENDILEDDTPADPIEEVPEVLRTTAQYLLLKTGKKRLTEHDVICLQRLFEKHTPVRIQKEIDTAIERCKRKGKSLKTITFSYIWACLKSQASFEGYTEDEVKAIRKEARQKKKKEQKEEEQLEFCRMLSVTPMPVESQPHQEDVSLIPSHTMTIEEAEQVIAEGVPEPQQEPPVSEERLAFLDELKAKDDEFYASRGLPSPYDPDTPAVEMDENFPEGLPMEDYLRLKFPDEPEETLHTDYSGAKGYDDFNNHSLLEDSLALDLACAHCQGTEADAETCPWRKDCSNGLRPNVVIKTDDWGRRFVEPCYSRGFQCKAHTRRENPFFDALVQTAGLTERQKGQTFTAYTPTTPDTVIAKAHAIQAARDKRSLILAGKAGTGKTHLAVAIALDAMRHDRKCLFRTVPEMLDELRKAAHEHTDFYGLLMKFKSISCLVLDDWGKEKTTPAGLDYIYQIIDYRYRHGLQTIITTNALTPEGLKNPWNSGAIEPLVSRVLEMGSWVKVEAENYRKILSAG